MNCEIVFYNANKTALCEAKIKNSFSELELFLRGTSFTNEPSALCKKINTAFEKSDICFVVGNLSDDSDSAKNVLSKALSDVELDETKKLRLLNKDGFVFRFRKQILILLPDSPNEIENTLSGALGRYIKDTKRKG